MLGKGMLGKRDADGKGMLGKGMLGKRDAGEKGCWGKGMLGKRDAAMPNKAKMYTQRAAEWQKPTHPPKQGPDAIPPTGRPWIYHGGLHE